MKGYLLQMLDEVYTKLCLYIDNVRLKNQLENIPSNNTSQINLLRADTLTFCTMSQNCTITFCIRDQTVV